jgi:hypothetical protein
VGVLQLGFGMREIMGGVAALGRVYAVVAPSYLFFVANETLIIQRRFFYQKEANVMRHYISELKKGLETGL